jgi:3-hydroxyisobutyrate dehydrogenase-like beta-hydroxyacid dehydrogenase
MRTAFIGTGAMGAAMAGHAIARGFAVCAYDPDPDALARAVAAGARAAESVAATAGMAEVFVIMVAKDVQTRAVVADLLTAGLAPGATIIVAATNHPRTMIDLAADCARQGVGFVDAPVCYGLQGALKGDLISLCGGSAEDIEEVRPLLMSYSRSVEHIGPTGSGQIGKTCNNMMHWAACVANYETLALARSCGIDAQAMRETLLKCPAHNTTLARWDTTKFTWHEKDMDVALEVAQSAGLPLPLFGLVDQLVKRLGPDDVRALLHGGDAAYLGQPITARNLEEITGLPE